MKIRYRVVGVVILDDQVKINIKQEELVKQKDTFNPFEAILDEKKGFDFNGMIEKTQKMAMKMTNQDSVTVPYVEWKKTKINVDDIIVLSIDKEK